MSDFTDTPDPKTKISENPICACGKAAKMACPTCIKLGGSSARFCDQECFKKSWNEHKKIHEEIRRVRDADPSRMPREFKHYRFTDPCVLGR